MGWLIALGILIALAWMPLGASARYDSSGPLALLIIGPVRIRLYPAAGKKKKQPEKAAKKKEKTAAAATGEKKSSGGPLSDFLPFVRILLDFLTTFRRKLRVNVLELNLILGGGDPCDLGQNYGKACAAMGNIWPWLEEFFVIQKRDVKLQCDFEASQTLVTGRLDITLTLGRLLSMGCRYGWKLFREFLHFKNKRKGGATI